jgi:lauroyl/myristoyl acyltransferase
MTLIGRWCSLTHPAAFVAVAHGSPNATGFEIGVRRVPGDLSRPDRARRFNAAIEVAVRNCPEQYLRAHHRDKHPAGTPLPRDRQ